MEVHSNSGDLLKISLELNENFYTKEHGNIFPIFFKYKRVIFNFSNGWCFECKISMVNTCCS